MRAEARGAGPQRRKARWEELCQALVQSATKTLSLFGAFPPLQSPPHPLVISTRSQASVLFGRDWECW